MSKLIFLTSVFLLVLQLVSSNRISDTTTYFHTNRTIHPIDSCRVFDNPYTKIIDCQPETIYAFPDNLHFCRCSMGNETGVWTAVTKITNENKMSEFIYQTFTLFDTMEVPALPRSYFFSAINDSINVHLDNRDPTESGSCYVYHNDELVHALGKSKDSSVQVYKSCGIRLLVREDRGGEWSLVQEIGFKRKVANFVVGVKRQTIEETMVSLVPGNHFYAEFGSHVRVYIAPKHMIEDNGESVDCFMYNRRMRINLYKIAGNESIERYGRCGVQMRVDHHSEGEWNIVQVSRNARTIGTFTITINKKTYQLWEMKRLPDFMIGAEIDVTVGVNTSLDVAFERPPGFVSQCDQRIDLLKNYEYIVNLYQLKHFCNLTIPKVLDDDYGTWTSTTVYKTDESNLHKLQLVNYLNIFQDIRMEKSGVTIIAHESSIVMLGFDSKTNSTTNTSCRLIHQSSGRKYLFADFSEPAIGIRMLNKKYCKVEIWMEPSRYGKWLLEERSSRQLKRGFFNVLSSEAKNDIQNSR